ncbi:MAG: hypothetical protein GWN00_10100 [Aliifodinibius sp.]|nr:hypothetical protein [Fodinibius sp.]NIV11544.1 hypothetical protein [Fodinibius sp.]NIY25141.1 hypothetical protein [Fodinibius sp.]
MKRFIITLSILLLGYNIADGQIIDMHLHGYTDNDYWGGHPHPTGTESPKSAKEHLEQTIQLLDKHNIEYAVVSGPLNSLEIWTNADPRFIPGYEDEGELPDINQFEELVKSGKIKIFGEITAVYHGRTLNDSIYQPYLAICEKYAIPVAYHTGGRPPMIPFDPIVKDYAVRLLKLAKTAGVLDPVMFGSDQMIWPDAITSSIEFLNSMDFLTDAEKEMILYRNAKKFLGINGLRMIARNNSLILSWDTRA